MLCLPKQFVHHLLPPLVKCNISEIVVSCHPYKFPDLRPPNSPDLNPVDYNYKMWGIIQQRVTPKYKGTGRERFQDFMQRLIDAWADEESVIRNVMDHRFMSFQQLRDDVQIGLNDLGSAGSKSAFFNNGVM